MADVTELAEFSVDLTEGICRIPLYDKYGFKRAETIIDREDLEKVRGYVWRLHAGYAKRWIKSTRKVVRMARDILDLPHDGDLEPHHKGDRLDNRKVNLKATTRSQHQMLESPNRSNRFRGVSWHKKLKKWHVEIQVENKRFYLGVFNDATEAAKAYDAAAKEYHKEFANLNFP